MKIRPATLLLAYLFLFSCKNVKDEQLTELRTVGDSVTTAAQQYLLKNVASAIQDSGTVYAINFCNSNAVAFTDQFSGGKIKSIQRLTNKERNPDNALRSEQDKLIFENFSYENRDTVIKVDKEIIYYKPIKIAVPSCLNCHGNASDIKPEVLQAIALKYPNDKALYYKEGDLRGMWKVSFAK